MEGDPEKRIADLERRLAQSRAASAPDASTTSDRLSRPCSSAAIARTRSMHS
jgi:hypothetical protein